MYVNGTVDFDKSATCGDTAEERGFDVPDDAASPEALVIKKETVTLIRTAVGSLSPAGQRLWDDLLSEKTKTRIAAERDLTEGAIRKQVKKLSAALREHPKLLNLLD